ncbi:MAG: AraC family transcriptional regulator [Clostridia bacterium]|nr:AraC family transcriptional regulator [Clostridia bacterium]
MELDLNELPKYQTSSYRYFNKGERHCERIAPFNVLLLVIDGKLRFGEDGESKEISANEYYIQRKNLKQDGNIPSDAPSYFYVHFDGDFCEKGLPVKGRWNPATLLPVINKLKNIEKSGASFLQKSSAFYEILCELKSCGERRENPLAEKIMIKISSAEYVSVKKTADELGVSVNYLIKVFKDEYGTTPHAYATDLRLAQALRLLKETTRTEEEIAFSVGYEDYSVFFKAFKKKYGFSPKTVRK